MKAAAVGNLDVVMLLVTHFKKCLVTGKVVIEAAQRGHTEILTWINARCSLDAGFEGGAKKKINPWCVVNDAVDVGHLDMVKWIFEQTAQTLEEEEFIMLGELVIKIHAWFAVRCGHFDVLKWLIPKHRNVCCFDGADDVAAETGRLDIVRWLWANNLVKEPRSSALSKAARNGHLHILKWLVAQDRRYNCTAHGHLDIVTFLHENASPVRSTNLAIMGAAAYGHLDIVKFLHGIRHRERHLDAMAAAIEYGNIAVAKWLHNHELSNSNIGNMATSTRLGMPARTGNSEIIQWCHIQQLEIFTSDVMDAAVGNGHLDVVKWLHANRTEGCTTYAMNVAASNGHLDVVKWLHENRTEGCTQKAMDFVAYQGHLVMIQWLNENRSEGCSDLAMKIAINNGNFEAAWYLHQARSDCDIITDLKECLNKSSRWKKNSRSGRTSTIGKRSSRRWQYTYLGSSLADRFQRFLQAADYISFATRLRLGRRRFFLRRSANS